MHKPAFEGKGAGQTGLFVHGEEALQRTVFHFVGHEHSQCGCHADAVVGAERSAARTHPFTIDVRLYGVGVEVVDGVVVFFAHHIHVGLQHDGRMRFVTRRGRLAYQHIAGFVGERLEVVFLTEFLQECDDFAFAFRWTRHLTNVGKNAPKGARL